MWRAGEPGARPCAGKRGARAENDLSGSQGWGMRVRMCMQGSLELNLARLSEGHAQSELAGFQGWGPGARM